VKRGEARRFHNRCENALKISGDLFSIHAISDLYTASARKQLNNCSQALLDPRERQRANGISLPSLNRSMVTLLLLYFLHRVIYISPANVAAIR